ncbi:MAG: leucine-rich repeat protein, partial [Synechococcus sp. SB0675_bin_6]|nr:leucine-rich repeat protein [Synechococcus sp. SB0675_bin_6]
MCVGMWRRLSHGGPFPVTTSRVSMAAVTVFLASGVERASTAPCLIRDRIGPNLAWAVPPLAAILLIFSPGAHPQTQNICERLNALSNDRKDCKLDGKKITSLSSGDFDGLPNLQRLNLAANDISSLPEDIFDGLSNLEYLTLNNNKLSSLPEGVFDDLSNLEWLSLYGNRLSSLPEDIFDGLSNLEYLNLTYNVLTISSLPENIFDGLSNLHTLRLNINFLKSLPEDIFDGLSNLEYLHLNTNQLSSLPEDVFDGLSNLRYLYLYQNELSSLPEGVFDGIAKLDSLYVKNNLLSCLPISLQQSVKKIDVSWCGVPTITITAGAGVSEGTAASFTLTASSAPAVALSVAVTVAQNGDYAAADTTGSKTVTIPTSGTATYTVATVDDSSDEADGSISVTVDTGTGYTVGSTATATVAVTDDDSSEPTAPAKPTGFRATAGNTAVTLAWDNPSNSAITKYQYQQKAGSGNYGSWTDIGSSGATTVSHRVTGLTNGTVYKFRIRAVAGTLNGAQSDEVTATPAAATAPAKPTGFRPTAGNTAVTLAWDN